MTLGKKPKRTQKANSASTGIKKNNNLQKSILLNNKREKT